MTLTPPLRKFVLSAHLTFPIGWLGAALAYLAIVLAAMRQPDEQTLRAAWPAMELIGWYMIVPLALASLLTGLVLSVGTRWGLFQHYWVLFSLALTMLATFVLVQHMPSVSDYARVALANPGATVGELRVELFHSGAGLLVLLAIQVMNVYKPRGLTPYGWRRQGERRAVTLP